MKAAFGFYVWMMVLLAVATVVEKYNGTPFVSEYMYGSWWFVLLWAVITLPALAYIIRRKMYRQKPSFLLHLSLAVILAGASLTFITGKQGMMHLRQGQLVNHFTDADKQQDMHIPFEMVLDTFYIHYYPGTETPADYVSRVHLVGKEQVGSEISMNHIFSHRGYRFYQSSFDDDKQGSWLSVNYDPWGIPVTYTGYGLLLVSMLWLMFAPGSGFRTLLKHPLLRQASVILLLCGYASSAEAATVLSREEAAKYAGKQVMYHDRVVPLNTLARDFVTKITGKVSYKGYTPEQVLTGFLFYPEEWQHEPIIRIKDKGVQRILGVGEYACLTDFFTDHKQYILQEYWDKLHQSGKQSGLLKGITEADEKVALIAMLREGTLLKPVPESGVRRLTNREIQLELLYNRIPFTSLLFKINLTLGLLSFILLGIGWKRSKRLKCNGQVETSLPIDSSNSCISPAVFQYLFFGLLLASFLFHTVGIGLRTYIGGRFPLSNGYETMLFTAWCVMLVALLCHRRFPLAMSFGFLLSGFTLLVASLGQMNPHITPLMPVLVSPLLSLHVSCIMMSYALFGFLLLNGLIALYLSAFRCKQSCELPDREVERLTLFSRLLLYPAVFLLGIGIFIGAIWANVSWGRYWAWDPKEVWALITFMVYALAFHLSSLGWFRRPVFFHLYLVLAFSTVLMTYFGVNYVLGGMHSYGS